MTKISKSIFIRGENQYVDDWCPHIITSIYLRRFPLMSAAVLQQRRRGGARPSQPEANWLLQNIVVTQLSVSFAITMQCLKLKLLENCFFLLFIIHVISFNVNSFQVTSFHFMWLPSMWLPSTWLPSIWLPSIWLPSSLVLSALPGHPKLSLTPLYLDVACWMQGLQGDQHSQK